MPAIGWLNKKQNVFFEWKNEKDQPKMARTMYRRDEEQPSEKKRNKKNEGEKNIALCLIVPYTLVAPVF